jgi:N-acyl-L-homoserine lactone synthetase
MHIIHITDPGSLEALFRFRHHVYVDELGWFSDMGGILMDEFDEISHNYAAYDDTGEVIGSVRVVPDSPLGLPIERCFPLKDYREGKRLVEICRLAVSSQNRTSRLLLWLIRAAYQCAVRTGATHIIGDAYVNNATVAMYEKFGYQRLGAPFFDPSYNRAVPIIAFGASLSELSVELPSKHPALHRFFVACDSEIDHG